MSPISEKGHTSYVCLSVSACVFICLYTKMAPLACVRILVLSKVLLIILCTKMVSNVLAHHTMFYKYHNVSLNDQRLINVAQYDHDKLTLYQVVPYQSTYQLCVNSLFVLR